MKMSEDFQTGSTPPADSQEGINTPGLNDNLNEGSEEKTPPSKSIPPDKEEEETEKSPDEKGPEAQENDLIGKPETYSTEDITLPEGMELNQDVLKGFEEFAGKVNLSQKGYGEAVNMGIKLVEDTKNRMLEAFKAAEEQKKIGYQREAFKDKEIGGEKLTQSVSEASTAYRKFATPDVQEVLSQTGLEYHPAIIKMFRRISVEMNDDTFAGQGSEKGEKIPLEQKMFPDMFK